MTSWKWSIDESVGSEKSKSMKWQVDEMTNWEMVNRWSKNWHNIKLIKSWIDRKASLWNAKLITYQVNQIEVDTISGWQNGKWT